MLGILVARPSTLVLSALFVGGGLCAGATTAGLRNKNQINSALSSVGQKLSGIFKPQGEKVQSSASFCQTFGWLCSAPVKFSSIASSTVTQFGNAFQGLQTGIQGIKTNIDTITSAIRELKSTFSQGEELRGILQGLVEGAPKWVKYIVEPDKQKEVTDFFQSDKLDKTKEGLKWLSGSNNSHKSKVFEVESGLLAHLMKKMLSNPDENLPKAKRFIQLLGEHKSTGGEVTETSSQGNGQPYKLTKSRLDKFMQSRDKTAQEIYELLLLGEIGASTKGIKIPEGAETVTSIAASLLSLFTRGSAR